MRMLIMIQVFPHFGTLVLEGSYGGLSRLVTPITLMVTKP